MWFLNNATDKEVEKEMRTNISSLPYIPRGFLLSVFSFNSLIYT